MRSTTGILALLLIALGTSNASADTHPKKLTIAVIDDIPSTRLAVQLLEIAYGHLGISIDTVVAPSRRALLLADSGQVDGDLFRIDTVARDYSNLIKAPYPLLRGRLHAVFNVPNVKAMPQPSAPPLMVAVRRGVIISEVTAEALGMEPVHAEDYDQMRKLLKHGRVAMALVADIEGISPLARSDWQDLTVLPEPVVEFELYHYLNRRHQGLAMDLAPVLEQLENNGVKRRILEKVVNDSLSD